MHLHLPSTMKRVACNTADHVNARIQQKTEDQIACCAAAGPEAIARRLDELDREWDIERFMETGAPTITLIGICMGLSVNRKWFILPVAVQAFFLMHALQGWAPPVPILRRLGIRTTEEIDHERNALKALRGDYADVRGDGKLAASVRPALAAALR